MKGTIIIIGMLLLAGSVVGAKLLLEHTSPAAGGNGAKDDTNQLPTEVVCWGHFDVENGVAGLYPKKPGDIVFVAAENSEVKEGNVLLQVNDKLARLKVDEARAAKRAAELRLDEAKLLKQQYALQLEGQEAVLRSVEHQIKSKERERDKELKAVGLDKDQPVYKTVEEMYREGLLQLSEKKKAEQAKKKQIQLLEDIDAKLKVELAEVDLKAKTISLQEAEEMVEHFKIRASSNGTILRVYHHKGETLGPN